MNEAVCPYCRAPLGDDAAGLTVCPSCGTPHHADCFEENGGCTVFGCSAAPPAEPKLSIGSGELLAPAQPQVQVPAVHLVPPPPPPPATGNGSVTMAPLFSSIGYGTPARAAVPAIRPVTEIDLLDPEAGASAKSRTTFLVLGALLGWAGVHSFYAGSVKKGFVQLGITVVTLGIAGFMVWIWAIIDICTITSDQEGIPFRM